MTSTTSLLGRLDRDPPRLGWMVIAAIATLPVQFEITTNLRLAPTDFIIVAYVFFRIRSIRFLPKAWSTWHLATITTLFYGATVAFVTTGQVRRFVFPQKTFGLLLVIGMIIAVHDYVRTFDDLVRVVRTLVHSVTAFTAVSIVVLQLQQAGAVDLSLFNLDDSRLSGLMVDPNAMGGLIGASIGLVILYAFLPGPLMQPWLARVELLVLFVGLFLTYSRSAWLGTAAGLITGVIVLKGPGRRRLATLAIVGIVAGLSVFLLSGSDSEVNSLTTRGSQASERFEIASEAWEDFAGAPVFGIGMGVSEQRHGVIIHNTTLWVLTEMGLLGLISVLGLFFVMAAWAYRASRDCDNPISQLATACLITHVVMIGLSMGIEALYQRHWWLVMAVIGWCHAAQYADEVPWKPKPAAVAS